jgi:hypothetical protein
MTLALASLLLAAAGSSPPPIAIRAADPGPDAVRRPLAGAEDVVALCRTLLPVERLHPQGDAVEQGDVAAKHEAARDEAILRRYAVTVPAAKLPFAPYDGPERRLSLGAKAALAIGRGVQLWPTDARDLAVEADAAAARRILDAQRAGRLRLAIVFDLPDDATCDSDVRGTRFTLPIEPVEWTWTDGDAVVARGGAGADRPFVTASQGARPRVDVGEPIAGPVEVKKAVLLRARDLEACYSEALARDPAVDGVVVVEMGAAQPVIAADSTGAPGLGACVQRVLGTLTPPPGAARVAVPIRFELQAPTPAPVPAGAAPR